MEKVYLTAFMTIKGQFGNCTHKGKRDVIDMKMTICEEFGHKKDEVVLLNIMEIDNTVKEIMLPDRMNESKSGESEK